MNLSMTNLNITKEQMNEFLACICSRRAVALIPGPLKDCSAKPVHSLSHGTAVCPDGGRSFYGVFHPVIIPTHQALKEIGLKMRITGTGS